MSNLLNRIVPVILVLVLCFSCLVSSVSATSFDPGFVNYYNLLDYDTADDDNSVTAGDDLIVQLDYTLPEANNVTAVDLIIYTASGTITSAYGGRVGSSISSSSKNQLSVEPLGNRIFRVYGTIPNLIYDDIEITLFTSASGTVCTVNSFLVWNARFDVFEEVGTLVVSDYDGNTKYTQNSFGATASHGMSAQTGTSAQGLAIAQIYSPNWKKYDFVQFYGSAYSSNITSVVARFNLVGIPYTINYLSGSVSDSLDSACSRRDFIITLDLRGIDRTIDDDLIVPTFELEIPYPLAQGGSIALYRVHGFIQQETFDPIIHYFRNIFSELSLFRANFFSVLGSLQTNLATWFTDLGNYLGGLLVTLNNNINAGFTNIATKFNTLLTNLGTWFDDVQTSFTTLRTTLGSKIDSMKQTINDTLNDLISGSTQQNQDAEDFNDSVTDQSSELEEMTGIMDSVEKPDVGDINMDLSGMVDPTVITVATTGIGSLLSNQIILQVLLLSFTFGLVGFILYGKK